MHRFHLNKGRYNASDYARYSDIIKERMIDGKDSLAVDTKKNEVTETHGSYGALILHPNWKSKRKEVIKRDQFKCVICGNGEELQVHHRQYHFVKATKKFKDPWDYPAHLLITLCTKCHTRGHSKFKVPAINT